MASRISEESYQHYSRLLTEKLGLKEGRVDLKMVLRLCEVNEYKSGYWDFLPTLFIFKQEDDYLGVFLGSDHSMEAGSIELIEEVENWSGRCLRIYRKKKNGEEDNNMDIDLMLQATAPDGCWINWKNTDGNRKEKWSLIPCGDRHIYSRVGILKELVEKNGCTLEVPSY